MAPNGVNGASYDDEDIDYTDIEAKYVDSRFPAFLSWSLTFRLDMRSSTMTASTTS